MAGHNDLHGKRIAVPITGGVELVACTNLNTVRFIRAFSQTRKPTAAICHGPWPLIEAGLVRPKRLTSWPSLRADLRNAGAEWVDEEVVVDKKLITSRKPDDIPAFNRAVPGAESWMCGPQQGDR